jgi:hypothetical protein
MRSPATPFLHAALAGTLLAACTVGPDYKPPPPPSDARFTETPRPSRTASAPAPGGNAQALAPGRDIPGEWWTLFRSPQVTELVRQALAANPDIAAAQATLRQARENLRAQQGSQFPTLSASVQQQRQQANAAAVGGANRSVTYSTTAASLNLSYTLDAFGGIARQIEQLGAQAEYQQFQLEATYLTLAANVVDTAITEAALQAQIDTTNQIVKAYAEALALTRRRFALGGVSEIEVLQQQALLDAQSATLPGLRKQLQQARNQLATYLGARPAQYTVPTLALDSLTLPDELPVSLPSKLVEQRPDIRAYAALVHAASANVGIATANTLPQITLSASLGRDAGSLDNLFTPAGIVWSLAGGLTQPIFNGGTLSARKRAAQAALEASAAQYSSTVNTAFQSVANALNAIERDAETLQAALAAQKTAATSLAVTQAQYAAGGGAYLSVLTAQQADLSARLNLISARAARFSDTVALFQALGGGWWNRQDIDPKTQDCCGIKP